LPIQLGLLVTDLETLILSQFNFSWLNLLCGIPVEQVAKVVIITGYSSRNWLGCCLGLLRLSRSCSECKCLCLVVDADGIRSTRSDLDLGFWRLSPHSSAGWPNRRKASILVFLFKPFIRNKGLLRTELLLRAKCYLFVLLGRQLTPLQCFKFVFVLFPRYSFVFASGI